MLLNSSNRTLSNEKKVVEIEFDEKDTPAFPISSSSDDKNIKEEPSANQRS
jgi:hypothetical protein